MAGEFRMSSFEEMPTRVKICGITRWEDARLAIELGAAALGFNFHLPSPRYIDPAAAREIILKLPPLVAAVGIFADEADDEHVAHIAKHAGIAVVQVHGPRVPRWDGVLAEFQLIRGVAVKNGFHPETLQALGGNTILLDAFDAKLHGGTGKTFNWALARDASRFANIILAGGLTPDNVGQAIREVRPFAVDVASGVEASPGIKDAAKLRNFFREVRRADQGIDDGN